MAFEFPIRVYWEDTDAGGIVFYANYLKYFERGRTEWLRALGISQQVLRERTGGMFVVSETSLKYHRPARLDDALTVTASLKESGRASLLIEQKVMKATAAGAVTNADVLCEGMIRIGWVDAASMKPARIPQTVLEVLK